VVFITDESITISDSLSRLKLFVSLN